MVTAIDGPGPLGYPPFVTSEAPILFIGGLGGSGTRAVAGTMMALGYYAGGCLNGANDNLIFTELFKRPDWIRGSPTPQAIDRRLALFEQVMREGVGAMSMLRWPALRRFRRQQGRGLVGTPGAIGWMTKEPNCHLFVEPILERWPDALFVYVTRHPLDMAYSDNKGQLGNWSWLFDLDPDGFAAPEAAQLEYWIRTQRRLDGLLARHEGRIYPLNFDAFAADPVPHVAALAGRLGLAPDPAALAAATREVIVPSTVGRWRERDLSVFTPEQLEFCRRTGWPVDP
ncbi:sulfotransferase family protein [Thalassobaculum salexigens]|uniref:sulfotransferase family protein n=1 Tax=Thalassobaculum salexigens TaxID=455360 RepID=UPI00068431AA|nr:sulfotransferase [Thalassobaculum salexigens]